MHRIIDRLLDLDPALSKQTFRDFWKGDTHRVDVRDVSPSDMRILARFLDTHANDKMTLSFNDVALLARFLDRPNITSYRITTKDSRYDDFMDDLNKHAGAIRQATHVKAWEIGREAEHDTEDHFITINAIPPNVEHLVLHNPDSIHRLYGLNLETIKTIRYTFDDPEVYGVDVDITYHFNCEKPAGASKNPMDLSSPISDYMFGIKGLTKRVVYITSNLVDA